MLAMSLSILNFRLTSESISYRCWQFGAKTIRFFVLAGAEAFRRDNPQAEVHFYPTGHFALETHYQEIAVAIRDFLDRTLGSRST
jgi:hypothetical protein